MIEVDDVIQFTVYKKDTGKYVKNLDMPSKEDALLNTAEDEVLIKGYFSPNTEYVNGLIKTSTIKKENINYINKADLVMKFALKGLIPPSSIGSIMKGDFPSFFDITELSVNENIEYRIWWAKSDKIFFDDPKFKYCMLNSKINLKDLVN